MKILILVLSYTEWPFGEFMQTQQETWDATQHPNVDVVYYHGGWPSGVVSHGWHIEKDELRKRRELAVKSSDAYEMMHYKFKLTLDAIAYRNYDLIFRTNSCSYIVKDKLLEVAKSLPLTNCYAGYQNGDYISGAGIFFSPDVLDILRNELTNEPHGAEDVLIGEILKDRVPMINDESRIDAEVSGVNKFGGYHYRFKTSNDPDQRGRDIENMRVLHEKLKQNIL